MNTRYCKNNMNNILNNILNNEMNNNRQYMNNADNDIKQ